MSFSIKNSHPKIIETIQRMLVDLNPGNRMPFYGEYNLYINFHERKDIPTAGVNVTHSGMNFYWNREFMDSLTQKQTNFLVIHEDFHLLFNHPKRTVTGRFDHKLSNIAQDMIINTIIWEDISHDFVDIPKDDKGRNSALFIPKEYTGEPIFEYLYEWLKDEKEKREKEKKENPEKGDGDDSGYGKNGRNGEECWDLGHVLDNMDENEGQFMDTHLKDEVPEELRNTIVKDTVDRLRARGLVHSDIEKTLGKLQKKRRDYLREIKRSISNVIYGTNKIPTIVKPNRRDIDGLKGKRKIKSKINVIMDVSGSMHSLEEKVLNYIYRNDIEVNLIMADTQVNKVQVISGTKQLDKLKLVGYGGTVLQPAIDYVVENLNKFNTVILTDGYTDSLDLSSVNGSVLIISAGEKCPITRKPKKSFKQIIVEE
jgi:predicted metal-dependent peptidase